MGSGPALAVYLRSSAPSRSRLGSAPAIERRGTQHSIRLFVAPEVSELSDFGAVIIEGFEIPALLTRRVSTTLELKSGQSFAMAGLLKQSNVGRNSRVPFLGDLPVLGPLFRSVRYTRGETELVVLVTASLVEPLSWADARQVPGDLHVPPSDWELYINGQLGASEPPPLAEPDAARLREMGLDRLRGPGAWATYEDHPVLSTAGEASPAVTGSQPQGEGVGESPEPPVDDRVTPTVQFKEG